MTKESEPKPTPEVEQEISCVLCGGEIEESPVNGWRYGNNPYPLAEEGRCCDSCNWARVIPARLSNLKVA